MICLNSSHKAVTRYSLKFSLVFHSLPLVIYRGTSWSEIVVAFAWLRGIPVHDISWRITITEISSLRRCPAVYVLAEPFGCFVKYSRDRVIDHDTVEWQIDFRLLSRLIGCAVSLVNRVIDSSQKSPRYRSTTRNPRVLIEVDCDTSRPRQEIIYGGCKIKRPLRERAKRNYAFVVGNDVKLCTVRSWGTEDSIQS